MPNMETLTVGGNTYTVVDAGGRAMMGDLSDLDTTDKSSLVAAINEAAQGGGGGGTSDYTDLTNKPSINSVELSGNKTAAQLSLATAAEVAAKYTKPSTGIPASDLASAVQTSLGKADTAIQAPSSPATGAFLVYNGSAWVAQTLSTWQGGNY